MLTAKSIQKFTKTHQDKTKVYYEIRQWLEKSIDHKPHEHADNITKLQQNRYVGILRLYFTLISAWQHICTAPNFPRPGAGMLPPATEIRSGPRAPGRVGLEAGCFSFLGSIGLSFMHLFSLPRRWCPSFLCSAVLMF